MKQNTRLRRERELRGWSQAKVAEMIGTETPTVSRWERGISFPYPYFREKLCELFGKDAQSLGLVPDKGDGEEDEESFPVAAPAMPAQEQAPTSMERLYDPAMPFFLKGTFELVGRTILLEQLKQRLCAGNNLALTALNGLPGVGKTTLAMALVADRDIQATFSDGILWAGLGPNPNVGTLLSRWGSLLGVNVEDTGQESNRDAWTILLRKAIGLRHMLLVIDDAWELDSALAFKVGGPNCAYLMTTRLPYIAVSFADEGATVVPELSEEDGVTLLARYVPEAITHDPTTAHELVRSVGALPLALALMGKYLRVQATSGQPRRLRNAIDHLHNVQKRLHLSEHSVVINYASGQLGNTPLSLQSVIEMSYQQLSPEARDALNALSVFPAKPNSFSEEAALAICQVPVEVLDMLSDAGLLETSSPGRYMLHQTIADYARSHLYEQAPYERLIAYGIHFVEQQITDYDVLEPESSTVLAALDAAHRLDMKAELVWGAAAIAPFLYLRGLHSLSERYLRWAYTAARELNNPTGLLSVVLHLGKLTQARRNYREAELFLHEGLSLARQLGDREQMSDVFQNLGIVANEQQHFTEAEAFLREGLSVARQLNDPERVSALLQNLGVVVARHGHFAEAETLLREGLSLARKLNDPEQISALLQNLGQVADEQGQDQQAQIYLYEGLALARQFGHRERVSIFLSLLGWILIKQEEYAQAEVCLQEGLALARQLEQAERIGVLLQNLGIVASKLGKLGEATVYLHESLDLARQSAHVERISVLLTLLASIARQEKDDARAEVYLLEALTLARSARKAQIVAIILGECGELYLKQQRFAEALTCFREMLELTNGERQLLTAQAYYGLARASVAQGDIKAGRASGERSLALFEALTSTHTAEIRAWLDALPA